MSADKVNVADVVPAKYAEFLSYCESRGKTHVSDVTKVDIATFAAISGVGPDYIEAVQAALHPEAGAGNPAPGQTAKAASQTVPADAGASERPLGQAFRVNPSDFENVQIQMLLLEPRTSAVLEHANYRTVGDVLAKSAQELLNSNGMDRELTQEVVQKAARFVDLRDYLRHVSGKRNGDVLTEPMGNIMRVGPKNNKSAGLHVLNMSPEAKAFLMKEGHCWSIGTLMGLSMSDLLRIPHENWDLAEEIVHVARKHIADEKGEGMPYAEPVGRAQQAVRRVLTGLKEESEQASASEPTPLLQKLALARAEKDAQAEAAAAKNVDPEDGKALGSTGSPAPDAGADKEEQAALPQEPAAQTASVSEPAADSAALRLRAEEQPAGVSEEPGSEKMAASEEASSSTAQPEKNELPEQAESGESDIVSEKTEETSGEPAVSALQPDDLEFARPQEPVAAANIPSEAMPEEAQPEGSEEVQQSTVGAAPPLPSEAEEMTDTVAANPEPGAESTPTTSNSEENASAGEMDAALVHSSEERKEQEDADAQQQDMPAGTSSVTEVMDAQPAQAEVPPASVGGTGLEPQEMAESEKPDETSAGDAAKTSAIPDSAMAIPGDANEEVGAQTASGEMAADEATSTSMQAKPVAEQSTEPAAATQEAASEEVLKAAIAAEPEEAAKAKRREERSAAELANEKPDAASIQMHEESEAAEPAENIEPAPAKPAEAMREAAGVAEAVADGAKEAAADAESAESIARTPDMTEGSQTEAPTTSGTEESREAVGALLNPEEPAMAQPAAIDASGDAAGSVTAMTEEAPAAAEEKASAEMAEAAAVQPVSTTDASKAAEMDVQPQETAMSMDIEEPSVETAADAAATEFGAEPEGERTQTEETSAPAMEAATEAKEVAPAELAQVMAETAAPIVEPAEISAAGVEEVPGEESAQVTADVKATQSTSVEPEEISGVSTEEVPAKKSTQVTVGAKTAETPGMEPEEISDVEAEAAPVNVTKDPETAEASSIESEENAAVTKEEAPVEEATIAQAAEPESQKPEDIVPVAKEEAPGAEPLEITASAQPAQPEMVEPEDIMVAEAEEVPAETAASAKGAQAVSMQPEDIVPIVVEDESGAELVQVTGSMQAAEPATAEPAKAEASTEAAEPATAEPAKTEASTQATEPGTSQAQIPISIPEEAVKTDTGERAVEEAPSSEVQASVAKPASDVASAEEPNAAAEEAEEVATSQAPVASAPPARTAGYMKKGGVSPLLLSFLANSLDSNVASKLVQMAPALDALQQSPMKVDERVSFLDMPIEVAEPAAPSHEAEAVMQPSADAAMLDEAAQAATSAEETEASISADDANEGEPIQTPDVPDGLKAAQSPQENATIEADLLSSIGPVIVEEPAAEEGDTCDTVPVAGEDEIPDDALAIIEAVPEVTADLTLESAANEEEPAEGANAFIPAAESDSEETVSESLISATEAEELPHETLHTAPEPVEGGMDGEPHPGMQDSEDALPEAALSQEEHAKVPEEGLATVQTEEIPATVRITQKDEAQVTLGDLARLIEDAHTSMAASMSEIERIAQKTPEEITLSELAKLIHDAREAKVSRASFAFAEPEAPQTAQIASEAVDMLQQTPAEVENSDLDAINEMAEEGFNMHAVEDMRSLEEQAGEDVPEDIDLTDDTAFDQTPDVSNADESVTDAPWASVQEALESALAEAQEADLSDMKQAPPAGAVLPDVPLGEDDWEAIEAALDNEPDVHFEAHESAVEDEALPDEFMENLADEPDERSMDASQEELQPVETPENGETQVSDAMLVQNVVASAIDREVLDSLDEAPEDMAAADVDAAASAFIEESPVFAAEEIEDAGDADSLAQTAAFASEEQAEIPPMFEHAASGDLRADERTEALLALDEELAELQATLDEPIPDVDSVNERLDSIEEELSLLGVPTEDAMQEVPEADETEDFPAPSSADVPPSEGSFEDAVQGYVTVLDEEEDEEHSPADLEQYPPQDDSSAQADSTDETGFVFPISGVSAPQFDEVIARKAPLAEISGVLADVLGESGDDESFEEDTGQEEGSFADVLGADPALYDDVPLAQLELTPETKAEILGAGDDNVGAVLREYVEDLISYKGVSPLAAVEVTSALARFLSVVSQGRKESAEVASSPAQETGKTSMPEQIMTADEVGEDDIDMPLREAFGVASAQFGRAGISFLNLSVRPRTCLRQAGCATISDVLDMSVDDLLNIRGMTATAVEEVLQKLETMVSKSVAEDAREAQERPQGGHPQMDEFEQPMAQLLGVDSAAFDWMDLNLLKVNSRTKRVLRHAGIGSVGDLLRRSRADLLKPGQMDLSSVGHLFQQLKHLAAIHEFLAKQTPSGSAQVKDYARSLGSSLGLNPDSFEVMPLDTLRVSPYTEQCLREGARCGTVADLLYLSVQDLLETPRMDAKAVGQVLRGLLGAR